MLLQLDLSPSCFLSKCIWISRNQVFKLVQLLRLARFGFNYVQLPIFIGPLLMASLIWYVFFYPFTALQSKITTHWDFQSGGSQPLHQSGIIHAGPPALQAHLLSGSPIEWQSQPRPWSGHSIRELTIRFRLFCSAYDSFYTFLRDEWQVFWRIFHRSNPNVGNMSREES